MKVWNMGCFFSDYKDTLFPYYIFTIFPKRIGKDYIFASVIKTNALWELSSSSITWSLSLSSSPSMRRGGLGLSMLVARCFGS